MLKESPQIEGLDESHFEEVEMLDDFRPGVTLVSFYVELEEMPAKSREAGHIVKENHIWIKKIMNLGNAILLRRIRDKVEFDKVAGKWKVISLAPGRDSDIKAYTAEWNAFARGAKEGMVGTPLQFLFKNDPAKVDAYKAKHITTIEQLEHLTADHRREIGMGSEEDQKHAAWYLDKIRKQAPSIEINNKLEEKDRQLEEMSRKLADYEAKLTELLNAQIKASEEGPKFKKVKRSKSHVEVENSGIEGME